MFEYSLVAGLTASGADVYLLHVTTTPSVSYVVRTEDFDCGIMISASHNPFYDNGIKVINGNGQKLEASVEAKIEEYIDGEVPEDSVCKKRGHWTYCRFLSRKKSLYWISDFHSDPCI